MHSILLLSLVILSNQTPVHERSVLDYVNPRVGTYGTTPNGNGGMIPSVGWPFAMTRWTPQTRENFISQVPYGDSDRLLHGFQATHQPAIWMGEGGSVVLTPGLGDVRPLFQDRGLAFRKADERTTPYVYEVCLDATPRLGRDWNATAEAAGDGPVPGGAGAVPSDVSRGANGRVRRSLSQLVMRDTGHSFDQSDSNEIGPTIQVSMSADEHAGHLMFSFGQFQESHANNSSPWIFIQVTRQNWTGEVHIDPTSQEISGYNPERQDYRLGPDKASSFKGYFVARFSQPFESYGTTVGNETIEGTTHRHGNFTGAFVRFPQSTDPVEVRVGVSYVSVDQARTNLDLEIPEDQSFDTTVRRAKTAWLDKLDRVRIEGVNATDRDHDPRTIFYTGLFHALQYPSDFSEPLPSGNRVYYSGYTDSVHNGPSGDAYYQSWSIWDTYRAEHSLLTLFAPERVNTMMRSLLRIFDWSGWLPMWANLVETNIMISTHADAVLANALTRGFHDFDVSKAWKAVYKDAFTPPDQDTELLFYDREPDTPYEARAGLTAYANQGWVPNDRWAESASRTLDYAFDDFACAVVGEHAGASKEDIAALYSRSKNYQHLWNNQTRFMQARNGNGSWAADPSWGWTEGDSWVYTFDVLHDVPGLAQLFGGRQALCDKLDEHFHDGHNEHSNEPSHHVPYLYSILGYPARAAETIRSIAWENYNATSGGLSGNEDLGQMSAWHVFSALGFYPVNPASDEYVVGSPFFENVEIKWPDGVASGGQPTGEEKRLVIAAPGAPTKPYIKSLVVDGKEILKPVLTHAQIIQAQRIEFEMSEVPTSWGTR
ncbi:glycosyl hydrolase family 92-domain-containing protein [Aspergillus ambiguus]|uniref:GH92 family glycosyl hydrolase n=1 Tax=Aspergillus ambiguus TaxID=176160 RepID=UPI003CCE1437